MQNNTINGRTPEEIKKGLECCCPKWESGRWVTCRDECPFRNEHAFCKNVLMACTLALLCRLECERDEARNDLDTLNYANTELHNAYEAMKRERDAAVELLHGFCGACANEGKHEICVECSRRLPFEPDDKNDCWQWRGVQEVWP